MSELSVAAQVAIPAMTDQAVARVRALELLVQPLPQTDIGTHHVLHAGLYARTILIPKGTLLTGALVQVATTLIVSGHVSVYLDGQDMQIEGYAVLPASAHRKQAFVAHEDTHLTMVFATSAQTIAEAEEQFTAEADRLISRQSNAVNHIHITKE